MQHISASIKGNLVQMSKSDYKEIKVNYDMLKKKVQQYEKTLQSLVYVLQQKESDVKYFKDRAHKYETNYVYSEAKVGSLYKLLFSKNQGSTEEFYHQLKEILFEADDRLKDSESQTYESFQSSVFTSGSASLREMDLDADAAPPSVAYLSGLHSVASSGFDSGIKKQSFESLKSSDFKPEKPGSREGSTSEDQWRDSGVKSMEDFQALMKQNQELKQKLDEFSRKEPEAWKSFGKTYESTVQQLRLEMNMERIKVMQLQKQIEALDKDNVKELNTMLAQRMAEVSKLDRLCRARDRVLKAFKLEYERLKEENKRLQQRLPGATSETSKSLLGTESGSSETMDRLTEISQDATLKSQVSRLEEERDNLLKLLEQERNEPTVAAPGQGESLYYWRDRCSVLEKELSTHKRALEKQDQDEKLLKAQATTFEEAAVSARNKNEELKQQISYLEKRVKEQDGRIEMLKKEKDTMMEINKRLRNQVTAAKPEVKVQPAAPQQPSPVPSVLPTRQHSFGSSQRDVPPGYMGGYSDVPSQQFLSSQNLGSFPSQLEEHLNRMGPIGGGGGHMSQRLPSQCTPIVSRGHLGGHGGMFQQPILVADGREQTSTQLPAETQYVPSVSGFVPARQSPTAQYTSPGITRHYSEEQSRGFVSPSRGSMQRLSSTSYDSGYVGYRSQDDPTVLQSAPENFPESRTTSFNLPSHSESRYMSVEKPSYATHEQPNFQHEQPNFKCENCYREFKPHEEAKYKDHVRKCIE